jgi:hypothetical protein
MHPAVDEDADALRAAVRVILEADLFEIDVARRRVRRCR